MTRIEPVTAILPPVMADAEPFWSGCDREELVLPRCSECARFSYPPRLLCPHCGSTAIAFEAAAGSGSGSGSGSVYSFTHVEFSPFGDFWSADVPYTVVRVDLDCGVRILSRLVGPDRTQVAIGDPVSLRFAPVRGSERKLPVFVRGAPPSLQATGGGNAH